MKSNISAHISHNEAVKSNTAIKYGIRNNPSDRQLGVMNNLAEGLFEKVRLHFGKPIHVSSFFRSTTLNKKIGGAKYSDHMVTGDVAAIDLDNDGYAHLGWASNLEIFEYIRDHCDYYKLIWEFDNGKGQPAWVHISYSTDHEKNKEKNTYKAIRKGGKVYYQTMK